MTIFLTIGFVVIFIIIFLYGRHIFHVPTYKGSVTDHFDGKRFFDPEGNEMGSFIQLMKFLITNKRAKWAKINERPAQEKIDKNVAQGIAYKMINHATVLIQHDGLNIITDPVFGKRASPFSLTGPKRQRPPAIEFANIEQIDVVIISHDHYDHLHIGSLKAIHKKHQPLFLVGLGLKKYLKKFNITNVIELDWLETHIHKGIRFTFHKAKHWTNRLAAPYKTLWGSWMIESASHTIYYAGDSAYGNHFRAIGEKYEHIDLALIPIGAYLPRFFMKYVHMNPSDAIQAYRDIGAKHNFAVHWGTFQLTHEGMFDPVDELQELMDNEDITNFHFDRDHNKTYFIS